MPKPAILLLLSLAITASITITGPAARGVGAGLAPAQAYRPAGDNAHRYPSVDLLTPVPLSVYPLPHPLTPRKAPLYRQRARVLAGPVALRPALSSVDADFAAGSEIGVIPWWWPGPCNRPASDMPPAPDGCPDYEPVAPPQAPIPPACVSTAHVEEWQEEDQPVTELFVTVDHPELCGLYDCPGTTHLTRYRDGPWTWVDIGADVSCAKDEGPLTWATLEILNASRLDALGIYTAPLPSPYLDLLAQLGGWQWHRIYLPIIEGGNR